MSCYYRPAEDIFMDNVKAPTFRFAFYTSSGAPIVFDNGQTWFDGYVFDPTYISEKKITGIQPFLRFLRNRDTNHAAINIPPEGRKFGFMVLKFPSALTLDDINTYHHHIVQTRSLKDSTKRNLNNRIKNKDFYQIPNTVYMKNVWLMQRNEISPDDKYSHPNYYIEPDHEILECRDGTLAYRSYDNFDLEREFNTSSRYFTLSERIENDWRINQFFPLRKSPSPPAGYTRSLFLDEVKRRELLLLNTIKKYYYYQVQESMSGTLNGASECTALVLRHDNHAKVSSDHLRQLYSPRSPNGQWLHATMLKEGGIKILRPQHWDPLMALTHANVVPGRLMKPAVQPPPVAPVTPVTPVYSPQNHPSCPDPSMVTAHLATRGIANAPEASPFNPISDNPFAQAVISITYPGRFFDGIIADAGPRFPPLSSGGALNRNPEHHNFFSRHPL